MSLRLKTLLVIGVTFVGLVLILYLATQLILLQGFIGQAEQAEAHQASSGMASVFQQVRQDFGSRFEDWANWDDAYEFVQNRNAEFQKSNLNPETFDMLRVNLMVFANTSGQVVFGSGYDRERKRRALLPESLAQHLVAGSPLFQPAVSGRSLTGILLLDKAPLLVSAQPIMTSERKGPCRGVLIVGRLLDEREIGRLQTLIHLPMKMQRLDRPMASPDFETARASLARGGESFAMPLDGERIAGYILEKDIYGEPALLVRVTAPRVIYRQGRISTAYFLIALIVIGVISGGVFLLLLERIILARLARLSAAVGEISETGDFSVQLPVTGRDELARLTRGINGMLDALRKSNERLEHRVRERTARLSESNRLLQSEIAERQHTERVLAEEKERLAVTLRCIGDGVISTDTAGTVVMMNQVAEELTGWSHEEAVGQPVDRIFRLVHEETRRSVDHPAARVLSSGEGNVLPTPALLIARDGAERVVADSCAPIRQRDGSIIGAVVVFRDITETRRLEAEILKAGKLESLGILAGGIAHDFNNILVGIIGNISMAKSLSLPDARLTQRLDEAEKASLRARDLTQQLLAFSRGGTPLKKSTAIGERLREWAAFVTRGSKVRCEFDIAADLWPVDIDAGQMGQVIDNLVINAVQAMPDGGVIRIRAENVQMGCDRLFPRAKGRYVKITVRDQGVGIPPEHLSRIFDPFFTTKSKGTGLGLTTSYSIVAKHDGLLTVDSQPEEGTTFHLFLPASGRDAEAPVETAPVAHRGRGRILVMDDDAIVRQVLGQMLGEMGYQAEFTGDGAEAVELYRRRREDGAPFDAVIMDLTIPGGLGGKEAIGRLQALDPGVKAIVSSGYCDDPVMTDFRRYGFRAFLAKPYKNDELSRVLKSVLAGETA